MSKHAASVRDIDITWEEAERVFIAMIMLFVKKGWIEIRHRREDQRTIIYA